MIKIDFNGYIICFFLGFEGFGGFWKKDEMFKFISMKFYNINIKVGKMYKLIIGYKDFIIYW